MRTFVKVVLGVLVVVLVACGGEQEEPTPQSPSPPASEAPPAEAPAPDFPPVEPGATGQPPEIAVEDEAQANELCDRLQAGDGPPNLESEIQVNFDTPGTGPGVTCVLP